MKKVVKKVKRMKRFKMVKPNLNRRRVCKRWRILHETKLVKKKNLLIKKINKRISGSYNLSEVLKIFSEEISKEFLFKNVIFIEFSPNNESQKKIKEEYENYSFFNEDKIIKLAQSDLDFLDEIVFKTQNYFIVNNPESSDFSDDFKNSCKNEGIKFTGFFPLKSDDDIWGLIIFTDKKLKSFTQAEIDLFQNLSEEIFLIIKNIKLLSTCATLFEKESILKNITNSALFCKNLSEALNNISREIGRIYGVDRVAIRLFDKAQGTFTAILGEYRSSDNIVPAIEARVTNELNEYICEKLFKNYKAIIIDNVESPNLPKIVRENMSRLKVKYAVVFPVFFKEEPLATIFLSNDTRAEPIKKGLYDFLIILANHIAVCINMFKSYDKLEKFIAIEEAIRNMILELKEEDHHDKIFSSFLDKTLSLFNVDRAIHLHFDRDRNIVVKVESLKDLTLEPLLNKPILDAKDTEEFILKSKHNIWVVNNVNEDIKNEKLKNFLKANNINAFLAHYNATLYDDYLFNKEKTIINAANIICSQTPKIWSSDEIENYRLIAETITLIYAQIARRQEVEYTKRTFLATLTHDLRSPILGEQKALEYIISRKPDTSLEKFAGFLQDIYYTNEDLLNIVNNILMAYHYESGQIHLNKDFSGVEEIINTSMRSVQHLADEKHTIINLHYDKKIPKIKLDKNQVARVLTNLISNAIKHNPSQTNIDVLVDKKDKEIMFSVKDNGIGIPEKDKANIFEKYPTQKGQVGTGLGLYLSKQIIEAHSGKIWFESEEGKGTTFFFTLSTTKPF